MTPITVTREKDGYIQLIVRGSVPIIHNLTVGDALRLRDDLDRVLGPAVKETLEK